MPSVDTAGQEVGSLVSKEIGTLKLRLREIILNVLISNKVGNLGEKGKAI